MKRATSKGAATRRPARPKRGGVSRQRRHAAVAAVLSDNLSRASVAAEGTPALLRILRELVAASLADAVTVARRAGKQAATDATVAELRAARHRADDLRHMLALIDGSVAYGITAADNVRAAAAYAASLQRANR